MAANFEPLETSSEGRTTCGEAVDLLPQLVHYGVAPPGRPRGPRLMRRCSCFCCISCQVLLAVQHDEGPLLAYLHRIKQQRRPWKIAGCWLHL